MKTILKSFRAWLQTPIGAVSTHAVIYTAFGFLMACLTQRLEDFQQRLLLWKFWYIPLGLGVGTLTYFWSIMVINLLSTEDDRPPSAHVARISNMMTSAWLFPLLAIPAFGEELVFRGLIQPMIIEGLSQHAIFQPALTGIVLPALLYGYRHPDQAGQRWTREHLATILALSGAAIAFGWVSYATGSVWPAILTHGSQNFIAGCRGYISFLRSEKEAV